MQRQWYTAGWAFLTVAFGVLAVTFTWLFLLAAAGCFLIGFGVERGVLTRARFAEALPFEMTWKQRQPTVPRPVPALGILDFELGFEREGKRFRQATERVNREVTDVGNLMTQYAPRFEAAEESGAKEKVDLAREFAGKVRPHARKMARGEAELRSAIAGFTDYYLKRVKSFAPEVDLGTLRPHVDSLLTASRTTRVSIEKYRDALKFSRGINLQQAMNEVLDDLIVTAENILKDTDVSIEMADAAVTEIDARASTTGVSRAERRRRRARTGGR